MKPEKNVLIVPLVEIKSTVVKRLLFIVVAEMLDAEIVSAIILDVLIFTGENVVVVNETMEALVAERLSQLTLFADTEVVVNVKLLHGAHPAMLVWKLIYYRVRFSFAKWSLVLRCLAI
jgi:hypothetical protein